MFNEISTGASKSTVDPRDIQDLSLFSPLTGDYDIYTHIDMLNVEHQKKVGACTAALKSYIEYLYFLKTGKYVRLSMAFLYIVTKIYIDKNYIEGSSLRSAINASMKYGVCTEDTMPSNFELTHEQFLSQRIPDNAWNEALGYRIGGYVSIPIEQSLIVAALDKYKLLYVRYEVGEEWYTSITGVITWAKELILPLRSPKKVISGHAVILNRAKLGNKVENHGRNTWSRLWGNNGDFYTFYENYKPTEAWAVTLESQMPLVKPAGPVIQEKDWRKLLELLRFLKLIK